MCSILLNNREGIHVLNDKDILYIKADGSYCILHLLSGKEVRMSKNMKWIQKQFKESKLFVQIHRTWIVKIDAIEKIERLKNKDGKGFVHLKGDFQIPIPAKNINRAKEAIVNFYSKNAYV
jgi:DNA-binding LytR/AlgR family response regulator